MMRFLCNNYGWVGFFFLVPALIIFMINMRYDNDDGKGGSLGFYSIAILIILLIKCIIKALATQEDWGEVIMDGEWGWFLSLLGITVIQQIVALIRNHKRVKKGKAKYRTLWLVIPFFLLLYLGFHIAINFVIGVFLVIILIEGVFSWLNGTLLNKKQLDDGTKIEGIGDLYHDKHGNKYTKNHDGSFTKKD